MKWYQRVGLISFLMLMFGLVFKHISHPIPDAVPMSNAQFIVFMISIWMFIADFS